MTKIQKIFKSKGDQGRYMPIAIRIALLSWIVAIGPLFFFMMVMVPNQKNIIVSNLASKANSLAVSLHDVAASAAVNEDYSSVVSAAQTLLKGDPDLNFLVVMKNDGFALVIEQKSWQVTDLTNSIWQKQIRTTCWQIEFIPLFHQRVFHFASPFDYSGIQWGWIHVGLSLKDYDQSVARLYRNSTLLGLICMIISLFGAIICSRQMVRPILKLRSVVKRISQGDLSVRADMHRKDELGNLAASVNKMAEALLQKNRILESVRFAAYHFLQERTWEETIGDVLRKIGVAADITKTVIYTAILDDPSGVCAKKLYEWKTEDIPLQPENRDHKLLRFDACGVGHWARMLKNNQIVTRSMDVCDEQENAVVHSLGIRSFIAIPVFVESNWWGMIVLEDELKCRSWTGAETSSFRALADMLGATIARQRFQRALIDSKINLEEKVALRTRELQNEVKVKEKALSDLSSAQSSLVEMSRASGMAEVATGVLHNVGNVLNSVNVSANMLMDIIRESRAGNIFKIAEMLNRPPESLAEFLTVDEKGKHIPDYLMSLGKAILNEHDLLLNETESLAKRMEHIKEIVSMQQNYGRVMGITETIDPKQLMEDALMLNEKALLRHHIVVEKEYEAVPFVEVDKHKVLQILLNLINNAKYACSESGSENKVIQLKIYSGQGKTVCMSVGDNGIGIVSENLTRIFQHGFTTRRTGHGFGLHSGALAAHELGGSLSAKSDGPGQGALFTLVLPVVKKERK